MHVVRIGSGVTQEYVVTRGHSTTRIRVCLTGCVLLSVLWERSCSAADAGRHPTPLTFLGEEFSADFADGADGGS